MLLLTKITNDNKLEYSFLDYLLKSDFREY